MKNVIRALLISSVCATGGWSAGPVGRPPQDEAAAVGVRAEQPQPWAEIMESINQCQTNLSSSFLALCHDDTVKLPEEMKWKTALYLTLIDVEIKALNDLLSDGDVDLEEDKMNKFNKINTLSAKVFSLMNMNEAVSYAK